MLLKSGGAASSEQLVMTLHINFIVIALMGFLILTLWYFYLAYIKTALRIRELKNCSNPSPTNSEAFYWKGIQANARKKFLTYLVISIFIGIVYFTRVFIVLPPAK